VDGFVTLVSLVGKYHNCTLPTSLRLDSKCDEFNGGKYDLHSTCSSRSQSQCYSGKCLGTRYVSTVRSARRYNLTLKKSHLHDGQI
jgi:hypothetical protein